MFTACARTIRVSALIFLAMAATLNFAQQPAGKTPSGKAAINSKLAADGSSDVRSLDNPDILRQMNHALEDLAARVSPAVVQIQTTGYGPLTDGDSDRGRTALIIRQHAVGSGVIVDANGYIMTNAHVVEGAHRIRVTLPMSLNSLPSQAASRETPAL